MTKHIEFPDSNEYPEYAEMYMKWVKKDGSLLNQLEESLISIKTLVSALSDEALSFSYRKDKWTIKEILTHIIDDERIYGYRALAFARNDKTNLPGFEQDDYARYSDTDQRSISNIMDEYETVRKSTITLFNGFSNTALERKGIANGNAASVRALGYHILGHELHHISIIKDYYLPELTK